MTDLFERAKKVIPGGVNSPVRAFRSVGCSPLFIESAKGAYLKTTDGRKLLDFNGSWGPLILGHAHDSIIETIQKNAVNGTSYGISTPLEVELAELIIKQVSSIDMVRLVNSGTEAVMTAIRLARGYTNRTKIIKFEGCYHGHSDTLLVSAGSGLLTQGITSSKGVPQSVVDEIIILPYNDTEAVKETMNIHGEKIAAIIVEPVAGNMGLIKPEPNFLNTLRTYCDNYKSLLIFDEVITGFRYHAGTYGDLINIKPDITTLGKIIGGGMPIGAIGGKKDIMEQLAPLGEVYQAGTLSGNPIAVSAGLASLKYLIKNNPYKEIKKLGEYLQSNFNTIKNAPLLSIKDGTFTPFFTDKSLIKNYQDAISCRTESFANYFKGLLKEGIYISPSQFEVNFISAAHQKCDIDYLLEKSERVLNRIFNIKQI